MRDATTRNHEQGSDEAGRLERAERNHLIIGRCIRWYRHEAADLTVEGRTYLWRNVATWLDDHYQVTLDAASTDQLQDWRDSQTCSPRSLAVKVSGLHVFFFWLIEVAELREDDPSRRVKRPRRVKRDGDSAVSKAMTEDQFRLALEAALHDVVLVGLLMLGRYCGLRRCELVRLRTGDVEPRDGGGAWLTVLGKGSVWRRVPCPPEVYAVLKPLLVGGGSVFTHPDGRAYTSPQIGYKVNSHLKRLGIPHTLHDTRHSCGTYALEQGANLREVQELLGHASPDTTAIYTHVQPAALAEVVDLVTRRAIAAQAAPTTHGVAREYA